MPSHCAVVNCSDKYVHSGSISFHRFPFKQKELLQKWKDFTQRNGQWMPSKWSAVCSRHFQDADFNCTNNRKTLKKNAVPSVRLPQEALSVIVEQVTLSGNEKPPPHIVSNPSGSGSIKSTCRFCGNLSLNCVSFEKSFELLAMIQKCFPTLQVLQDDTLPLPKDICGECCKQLQRFSQFCDVVMLAQSEMQRKYRRQLKIKQEPVVRVKQEAGESLDNLFPDDMDMALDEHETDANNETEQKFQFCDFPMLNAQDIINNCDIMEIINLDDPFINIADDADVAQAQPVSVPAPLAVSVSVPELLQSELLNEEHNYAKEDWQLQPPYKTEKLEGSDAPPQPPPPPPPAAAEAPPTSDSTSSATRSSKPIVTNVSQIPPPPPSTAAASTNKPNIVVLNDSVVQSSAFRLHNCSLCSTKFFTAENLHQHYTHIHGTAVPPATSAPAPAPMVSVPPLNINLGTLKLEGSSLLPAQAGYWQTDWLPSQQLPAKKKIDILDMQRSFLHHNDLLAAAAAAVPQLKPSSGCTSTQSTLPHRKCRKLRQSAKQSGANAPHPQPSRRHRCLHCTRSFASVQQLLSHRQRKRHFAAPPNRIFSMKCAGCQRLFRTRLALRQHLRYICQALPLRNTRLRSYKCRHCRSISFTHWRVYRRHELRCRQPPAVKPKVKRRRLNSGKRRSHSCSICQKVFGSLTGLKQHRITHSSERRYKCSICERVFKRRNGLSQHVKGFHLQLKPHQCPVCQHRYALKCDMLRCRHSQRRVGAHALSTDPVKN